MRSLYRLRNEDFKQLTPKRAEDFIRDLLFARARGLNLPLSGIDFSSKINLPDGGADAYVECSSNLQNEDLLYSGETCYQVKSGSSFNPTHESEMKKELFRSGNPVNTNNLKKYVRKAMENDGHYILICLGRDLDNRSEKKDAIEVIEGLLNDCGFSDPEVDVWGPNKIISFTDPFPSLALRYKQNPTHSDFITSHEQWGIRSNMEQVFHCDVNRKDYIDQLRSELRDENQAKHIHISGAPGIGKTRLVLEATEPDDLKPLIVYAEDPDSFRNFNLMNLLTRRDNDFKVILVLDDCPPEVRAEVWNKLKSKGPRIKLITISTEIADTTGRTENIDIRKLEDDKIEDILKEYISEDELDRWVKFCDGNPRMANVIGQNLERNPEDILRPPDTVDIWGRFIAGRDDKKSSTVKNRRRVLRYLSLFKRFGYAGNYDVEVDIISELIEENFSHITRAVFEEIVHDLQERKILQGTNTLYITPKPLHIKLWSEWWNNYGNTFNFEEFVNRLEGTQLLEWFFEMFKYARESEAAIEQVNRLLGEGGPFKDTELLETQVGGNFFKNLSEANPEAGLDYLEGYIGEMSKEELLNFTSGRRHVVRALEKIAVWDEMFVRAAKLLLQLGEAENESFSNNASGVFKGLFSPAPGKVAPTEAPPIDRFPVLEQALQSESKDKKRLALDACEKALETMRFSRFVGSEYQGLRKEPDLWFPESYGEFFEYYRRVWNLLCEEIENLEDELKERATEILMKRGQEVGRIPDLAELVTSSLQELVSENYIDDIKLLKKIKRTLHYHGEDMENEVRELWKDLKNSLTRENLSSELKRFISIDPLMIEESENLSEEELKKKVTNLAKKSLVNEKAFFEKIDWLMSKDANGAFQFGYQLAKEDDDYSLLEDLISYQKQQRSESKSYNLIGGYFHNIYEDDPQLWEEKLRMINSNPEKRELLPEIIRKSGLTSFASDLILELADDGLIPFQNFKTFGRCQDLPEDDFKKWLGFLRKSTEPYSNFSALFLISMYYLRDEEDLDLPKDETLQFLISEAFFGKAKKYPLEQSTAYIWVDVAEKFIELYPEMNTKLAETMIANFGKEDSLVENDSSYATEVLEKICHSQPEETWNIIKDHLSPPIDEKTYNLKNWLMGKRVDDDESAPIDLIPKERIFEWVNENTEDRAWFLASLVPKDFTPESWSDSLAREVLVKYGDREDVRRNIDSNYFTEAFWGSESKHFEKKREQLSSLRQSENDDKVITWIDEMLQELDRTIEEAKSREERRDY